MLRVRPSSSLFALVVLTALPATAQIKISIPGIKLPGSSSSSSSSAPAANPEQDLRRINGDLQRGFSKVPKAYGDDPERELKGIQEGEAIVAKAEKELNPGHKLAGDAYKTVTDNIAALKDNIRNGKLAHACSAARMVILEKHNKLELASDAELKALDDAAATFAKEGGKGWENPVKFFQDEAKRLRDENPRVGERAVARAAQQKKRANEKEFTEATREANRARKAIFQHLSSSQDPIPEDLLKALVDAGERVKKTSEGAALFYETEHRHFLIDNAFRSPDKEAFPKVAELYEGDLIASGKTSGKKMKVSFKTKKNWCYTMVSRFATHTGGEEINHFSFDAKGGNTPLQEYNSYREMSYDYQRVSGVCTTKPVSVTATADLKFAGTKNGVRYVVVGWPKDKFPTFQATYMGVYGGDSCDTEAWDQLWTNPVPGSIVYSGNEPFILTSPDRAGQMWVTMMNATRRNSVRAQKQNLSSKPQGAVAFRTQFEFRGCPSLEYAKHKDSIKLGKCHQKIDKKYQKPWDRAQRERENAKTLGALKAAEAKLERLREKDAKDRRKLCAPIEKQIKKKWQKTFDRIVDAYADKAYSDEVGRAERLAAEDEVRTDF